MRWLRNSLVSVIEVVLDYINTWKHVDKSIFQETLNLFRKVFDISCFMYGLDLSRFYEPLRPVTGIVLVLYIHHEVIYMFVRYIM